MLKACDPTILVWICLQRQAPDKQPDPRLEVMKQVDAFARQHGLKTSRASIRRSAADIDLLGLDRSPDKYDLLFQAHTDYPEPAAGTYYESLVYAYHDSLIVQVVITRFADWVGNLTEGWHELSSLFREAFEDVSLNGTSDFALGVSVVYWAIADDELEPETYEREVRAIADGMDLRRSATDLGPLWRCEQRIFPNETLLQDFWILVSPRTKEKDVNRRYVQPYGEDPPDFPIVALARHKILFERSRYLRELQSLKQARNALDRRADKIFRLQRRLAPELHELLSKEAIAYQQLLVSATASLAEYNQTVSLLRELRRTVLINVRNFTINAVMLASAAAAEKVDRSMNQEQAASDFFATLPEDEIFGSDIGNFHGFFEQLNSDVDYADSLIERHSALLRSASEQLRIAGERELGEMAHHLSVDSAAVVASIAAVVAVEIVLKRLEGGTAGEGHAWNLALLMIVGAFAATQTLSSGGRGKILERSSVALTFGFLAGFLATRAWTPERQWPLAAVEFFDWRNIAILIAGAIVGWLGHSWWGHRIRRRKHQLQESE